MASFSVDVLRDGNVHIKGKTDKGTFSTSSTIRQLVEMSKYKCEHKDKKCCISILKDFGDTMMLFYSHNDELYVDPTPISARQLYDVPGYSLVMDKKQFEEEVKEPDIIPKTAFNSFRRKRYANIIKDSECNDNLAVEMLDHIAENESDFLGDDAKSYEIEFSVYSPGAFCYLDTSGLSRTLARIVRDYLEEKVKDGSLPEDIVDNFSIHVNIDYEKEEDGSYELVFTAINKDGPQIDITDNPEELKNRLVGSDLLNSKYVNVLPCVEA